MKVEVSINFFLKIALHCLWSWALVKDPDFPPRFRPAGFSPPLSSGKGEMQIRCRLGPLNSLGLLCLGGGDPLWGRGQNLVDYTSMDHVRLRLTDSDSSTLYEHIYIV